MVEIATGEVEDREQTPEKRCKDPAAKLDAGLVGLSLGAWTVARDGAATADSGRGTEFAAIHAASALTAGARSSAKRR